jgi:hypothetical protein
VRFTSSTLLLCSFQCGTLLQLGYTILYAPNVPATLKFYEVAFGPDIQFLHDSGDYGELATGSTALVSCPSVSNSDTRWTKLLGSY